MGTVVMQLSMLSSLILTVINGGFQGSVMIISGEAALDPLCAASNVWFCSPTDSDISGAQEVILAHLRTSLYDCRPYYNTEDRPSPGAVPDAYVHSSCASNNDRLCGPCLEEATAQMRKNCEGKDGAQYGNELCCARYEKERFC